MAIDSRTGAAIDDVPTDPCVMVDLSHLSEADQDAWLWHGIDLVGGPEAFKRRLCEIGLSDVAAGLADVLAACPRPADIGSAILEDWILAAFPYDPNPPERLPRRNCWVGPIQGSRRPSATSKP